MHNYLAVDIQTFRRAIRDINFDVYLKLSEDNYAHVFSRTTGLDYKRLHQYIVKGVTELHIRPEDEPSYKAFIEKTAEKIFNDPSISQEKKVATLLNMTEQNMSEVFTQLDVPEETAENTQKLINNYLDLMVSSPNSLAVMLKLVSHGEYLYYHSIAVSIFSIFIAKASGQFNRRMLELVGLGGFLHDIGCVQLPKEVNCSPTELTKDQWKLMHSHPKLGLQMIEKTGNIPDEVRYIVYQHHEDPNGEGYPNSLEGPMIYYPAKIVAVADAFSALISKRPFRAAYSADQAIRILATETGKHDPDIVRVLASVFLRQASLKKAA